MGMAWAVPAGLSINSVPVRLKWLSWRSLFIKRAFALDADLTVAHQFYTFLEVDTGRAAQAMHRLLKRLHHHPSEPETFAGLVRYSGFADC